MIEPDMIRHLGIVTPVLDDWDSLAILLRAIDAQLAGTGLAVSVFVVDDGSRMSAAPERLIPPDATAIASLRVIRLATNLGHQRAIAIGLIEAARAEGLDAILVLDSDGEDRPEDIAALLEAAARHPDRIIMAQRAKRSESLGFRIGYQAYKLMFWLATGRVINFGNFSLLPVAAARRLIHMPELWNNLAAAIMRSRIPFHAVPTERGQRYAGQSRLNTAGLITHGLSAISVYADLVFVRILAAASVLAGLSILGMLAAAFIRVFTDLATPGWATNVVGSLLVVLLQTVVIVIAVVLMQLAGRSNRQIVPAHDAPLFVAESRAATTRHADG